MVPIFNRERKVVSAIRVVILVMLLSLIALWLLGGGINKIIALGHSFSITKPSDILRPGKGWADFKLPWQTDMPQIDAGIVATPISGGDESGSSDGPTHAFANASPYADKITIDAAAAQTQNATGQYLVLQANGLDKPIDVSGWKLESALTGAEATIPQAAPLFVQGRLNAVANVQLRPGGVLVVSTGPSPVGVSFAENACTGYLGTVQSFTPFLSQECPAATTAIPRTPENESRLGSDCFAYLSTLSSCTFPSALPSSLSNACRAALQNTLSYNSCVAAHRTEVHFATDSWRLFLGRTTPLWQSEHDVIRLLDANGRVVAMISY